MNSEIYSYIFPRLFEKGALDVYLKNIIMKKNRPGIELSIIVDELKKEDIINEIFKQTTTFGVRIIEIDREILERRFNYIDTKYGKIKVKIGSKDGEIIQISPEYEDIKSVAERNNISIKRIYDEVNKNIVY